MRDLNILTAHVSPAMVGGSSLSLWLLVVFRCWIGLPRGLSTCLWLCNLVVVQYVSVLVVVYQSAASSCLCFEALLNSGYSWPQKVRVPVLQAPALSGLDVQTGSCGVCAFAVDSRRLWRGGARPGLWSQDACCEHSLAPAVLISACYII